TTPPHLHFGIYRRGRGPIDPLPYIRVVGSEPAPIQADPAVTGGWVTPQGDGVRIRAAPSAAASIVTFVDDEQALRVLGVTGEWFRVHLPDGSHGFLARRVASADVAVAQE
ncbi:MAG: SH3 domain-containing protein, partial [Gemmatimonadetes bacterium]|nr:SH3 domain-containing protein [Gemmatimonadota bacterium]NIR78615.1 SH3 domain-containing protein [Gemmatimonadota bacterium]NIT87231.1 SH3 domain-containing protein [Gemmatimonadota bacterium]NIU31074.1 SH3 domain-containing protein [Gemmatimonadota bacterium]NIU35810.1 SH3 domain-containing protein [Gemmatimonadota bacterium]